MKRINLAIIIVLMLNVLLSLSVPALAVDLPEPNDDFYVLDQSNIIASDTEEYIIEQNIKLYEATGAQIVVVTEDFVPDGKLEAYAYNILNEWGIGDKDKNNGILLLISIGDDEYWCTQGTGLEKSLSSGKIGNLLEAYLEPDFAKQQYDEGIKKVFDALLSAVGDIYDYSPTSSGSPNASGNYTYEPSAGERVVVGVTNFISGITTIVVIVAIVLAIRAIARSNDGCLGCLLGWSLFGGRRHDRRPPPPRGGFDRGRRGGFGGGSHHGGSFGGGRPSGGSFGGSRGGSGRSSGSFGGSSSRGGSRGGGGSTRGGGAGRRH